MTETTEYMMARVGTADRWVPACGGQETPFSARTGKRMLYCFNFALGKHAYLDCDTDTILTDADALAHLNGV
jgi:hypothetical protein